MNTPILLNEFDALALHEQMALAQLALLGEPTSRTALLDQLRAADILDSEQRKLTVASFDDVIRKLERLAFISVVVGRGFVCNPRLRWPALHAAINQHRLHDLCLAYEIKVPLRQSWNSTEPRSYRAGIARLRMAYLRGQTPQQVHPLLAFCMGSYEAAQLHPILEIFGQPLELAMLAQVHAQLQDEVLTVLLQFSQYNISSAPVIRQHCQQHYQSRLAAGAEISTELLGAMAQDAILCGACAQAELYLQHTEGWQSLSLRACVMLLRGDSASALTAFELALKTMRRETGKRTRLFQGISSYLYTLALLRSDDAKHRKAATTYLDLALRASHNHDSAIHQQIELLREIRSGTLPTERAAGMAWSSQLQTQVFQCLLYFWLSLPQLAERRAEMEDALAAAEAAGYLLLAAQLASMLAALGDSTRQQQAERLRAQWGFCDLGVWFERQEDWQRQLTALINLQQPASSDSLNTARLAWLLSYHDRYGLQEISAVEQKRDARGQWSKGRAISLKRLRFEPEQFDYLTPQDLRATEAISVAHRSYHSSGLTYDINPDRAAALLVGHPLLFWKEAPDIRVELLAGAPELLITKQAGSLALRLQPEIPDDGALVIVSCETPTRLRVISILDEHRRIAAIVGSGLVVPARAEAQVLEAISAMSSMVTVQSEIGGAAPDMLQLEADTRLHLHLLPYQHGLKLQILVRPLANGAYYAPGAGAANVIAEIDGKPARATRQLADEKEAERQLIERCPILGETEQDHDEWLLGQPALGLQLLAELQELAADSLVLAWPEGQPFALTAQASTRQLRLNIKSNKDWFAASGELQVAEDQVIDLKTLLELMRNSQSRFVELSGGRYLALTEALHRRLQQVSTYGELHGDGVRLHPLAAFSLEELAGDVGTLKSDKRWKQHLEQMAAQAAFEPQLPSTLQAELRDYQLEGYNWLARLAHWGVGACLADDMGLGKTLQALALILARAPQGPTLVVAPTSVCLNWISEAARFAPTLKVHQFGAGDRAAMLGALAPFDVVVTSYGLLQLEAARFAGVQWHTIVLDEAQAIKNGATKRSQAVMALKGDFRMVATGTPLENHLGELWNLFRFINPGLLGNLVQFNLRFAGPIEKQQDHRAEVGARKRLRRLIQPFMLRRTKAQVLSELPARTEITLEVDLSPEEATLYESLRRAALEKLAQVEGPAEKKSMQILAEIMKLRRACCNPQLVAPELGLASSKLAAFSRLLLGLLENRHKVLVFSQFVDHLALIRAHLDQQNIAYQYLDGATPMAERKKRVDLFQGGQGEVFLISLKAGGVGINLTAADYVIHMDPWWNPAVEDQASDRAHRMGQQRPVTIYRLVARHTIEEGIVELHQHKRDLADSLLEGADVSGRMSASDMLAMLQEGLRK